MANSGEGVQHWGYRRGPGRGDVLDDSLNLIQDPGLESGGGPWVVEDGGSIVNDGHARSGAWEADLRDGGQVIQRVDVAPNTSYTLTAWVAGTPETHDVTLGPGTFMFVADYTGVPDDRPGFDNDGDDGLDGPRKIEATGISVGAPYDYGLISLTFNSGSRTQLGVNVDLQEGHILVDDLSLIENPVPVPAAPELLLTPADGQVNLSWTASAGADTYTIYRGDALGSWHREDFGHPFATGVTGTSFTDNAVVNGQLYAYIVQAKSSNGGALSKEELVIPPGAASPPAPADLRATASDGQVSLSWSAAPFANSYVIFRTTDPTLPGPPAIGPNTLNYYDPFAVYARVADTSLNDPSVTNGTTYYYVVASASLGPDGQPVSGGLPFDGDVPNLSDVVSATPGEMTAVRH